MQVHCFRMSCRFIQKVLSMKFNCRNCNPCMHCRHSGTQMPLAATIKYNYISGVTGTPSTALRYTDASLQGANDMQRCKYGLTCNYSLALFTLRKRKRFVFVHINVRHARKVIKLITFTREKQWSILFLISSCTYS